MMVRAIFIAAALLNATPAKAQETLNDLAMKEWLTTHAPDGFDVYPDGSVWVSAGWSSTGAEYAILADDLKAMQPTGGYVWLLGDF